MATLVYWNAAIVAVAVFGCVTSKYVNFCFYFLGEGHWTGYVYVVLIGYRAYALIKLCNLGGLVLTFVACWIIVEMKTLK